MVALELQQYRYPGSTQEIKIEHHVTNSLNTPFLMRILELFGLKTAALYIVSFRRRQKNVSAIYNLVPTKKQSLTTFYD